MESETLEEELILYLKICIDSDSSTFVKPPPPAPQAPPADEKYIDLEKYIQEKCEDKLKILDRSTFHQIERPILISFNHFREKCYHHSKWLDILYQLSQKYGDHIDFLVADQIDLDVIYPHKNPMDFFLSLYRPEDEHLQTYAIDEKRRMRRFQYCDAQKTPGHLLLVCETLLRGSLFISQPIPEKCDSFVKICVHHSYEEMVRKSTKDIFLIVELVDYQTVYAGRGPNYEQIAAELKESNIDTVFINGLKNYIPFEFSARRYPQLIFIPCNDRNNFIHYSGRAMNTESVLNFIGDNLGSKGQRWRQKEIFKLRHKPFTLVEDAEIRYEDLNAYINDNFPKSLKVLDRSTLHTIKTCIIIYFMDFRGKGVAFHVPTLQRIHQVAQAKYGYGVEYLIADLKDIDVLHPNWWYTKYGTALDEDTCHVFKIDRMKDKHKIAKFKTTSSLCYHSYYFNYTPLYRSQPWAKGSNSKLVTMCVAQNLNSFIATSKNDIFLTIYWGTYKGSFKILKVLDDIAGDVKKRYNVRMLKMDAKLNYVPLEYSYTTYPVHFFIPRLNKDVATIRYISSHQGNEDILEFIRKMTHPCT